MNLVGHLIVAERLGAGPASQLGAMVPDLVRLAGLRTPAALPEPLAAGVFIHHRTDDAFHQHRAFVAGSAKLRLRLMRAGLPSGAARAVAHAGWEMLLDGAIIANVGSTQWGDAMGEGGGVRAALSEPGATDWDRLVDAVGHDGWPARYADVDAVAERLLRVLAHRPRLAVPPQGAAEVRRALAEAAPAVHADAGEVLADVITSVLATVPAGTFSRSGDLRP